MLRSRSLLLCCLFVAVLAAPLSAQGLRIVPMAGVTAPVAGTMTLWEPLAMEVGIDSMPWRHRYLPGTFVGLAAEWDRPGGFDWTAQVTGTFSERVIKNQGEVERNCDCTSSVIMSAGILARTSLPISGSLRVLMAAGPELYYYGGEAVSNADGFAEPQHLEVDPRLTFGGFGSMGLEADVHRRFSLRLQAGYRILGLKHRVVNPIDGAPVSYNEEAKQDVVVSLGLVMRRGGTP